MWALASNSMIRAFSESITTQSRQLNGEAQRLSPAFRRTLQLSDWDSQRLQARRYLNPLSWCSVCAMMGHPALWDEKSPLNKKPVKSLMRPQENSSA